MVSSKKLLAKQLWISFAAISIMIALLEFYAESLPENIDHSKLRGAELNTFSTSDDILGYIPAKNLKKNIESYYGDELLYSVTYSTNEKGIRISPPEQGKNDPDQECIVFFGGSFTFGHGVNDNETLPYLVSTKSNGKYRTFNLGFNGWGAHHMLSILEHNLERDKIDCEPKFAIYQALVNHVDRVVGRASWDKHGPRYIIDRNGALVLKGKFSDSTKSNMHYNYNNLIYRYLNKSNIIRKMAPKVILTLDRKSYIELYMAITEHAKSIFENRYPNSEFYVILWDDPKFSDISITKIHKGLLDRGIKVFLVSKMLPGYRKNSGDYQLSPHDRHPAPKAYEMISEYIIENILDKNSLDHDNEL